MRHGHGVGKLKVLLPAEDLPGKGEGPRAVSHPGLQAGGKEPGESML